MLRVGEPQTLEKPHVGGYRRVLVPQLHIMSTLIHDFVNDVNIILSIIFFYNKNRSKVNGKLQSPNTKRNLKNRQRKLQFSPY